MNEKITTIQCNRSILTVRGKKTCCSAIIDAETKELVKNDNHLCLEHLAMRCDQLYKIIK